MYTDGKAYGVTEGLIFSLPLVTERGGAYKVVADLSIDDFSKGKLTCVVALHVGSGGGIRIEHVLLHSTAYFLTPTLVYPPNPPIPCWCSATEEELKQEKAMALA